MSEKQTPNSRPPLIDLEMVDGKVVEQVVPIPELHERERSVLSRAVSEIKAGDKALDDAGVTHHRRVLGITAKTKQLVSLSSHTPKQTKTVDVDDVFSFLEPATITVSHALMDDLIKGKSMVRREISEADYGNYRRYRSPGTPEYAITDLGRVDVAGSEQTGDYWARLNDEFIIPVNYLDLPEMAAPDVLTAEQQLGAQALRLDAQQ